MQRNVFNEQVFEDNRGRSLYRGLIVFYTVTLNEEFYTLTHFTHTLKKFCP
jgi:hypothetical protein